MIEGSFVFESDELGGCLGNVPPCDAFVFGGESRMTTMTGCKCQNIYFIIVYSKVKGSGIEKHGEDSRVMIG